MANGLLGAIANPAQADVLGSLEEGRKSQARDLAGDILGKTQLAGIGRLARLDPEMAINIAKAAGFSLDSKGQRENEFGIVIAADKLIQAGLTQEAAELLGQEADKIESFAGPGKAQKFRITQQALLSGGQEELLDNFHKFAQSIAPKKEGTAGERELESIIKDFTPEQQKNAKLIKAGLKGRAMSNALLSAIESGDVTNLADAKAEIKQAEKFAELTGSSRAKAIDKGFDSIAKIDAGTRNIDRAITAIKGGAGVGAVEKIWPSIKAASVELDNIRGDMALDVVGAVSFGALSKGELDLAKDVALPTGLNTEELIDFLTRKKAAQTKLRAYYNEQIQFLDQGGTVAGFLRQKERGASSPSEPAAPQVMNFDAQGNPI